MKYSLGHVSHSDESKCYLLNYQIPLYAAMELKEVHDKYINNKVYIFFKELINSNLAISLEIIVLTFIAKKLFSLHGLRRFKATRWICLENSDIKSEISAEEKAEVLRSLEGRILMRSEISRELKALEISESEISFFLQQFVDEAKCSVKPGISQEKLGWKCNRCESKDNFVFVFCSKCGSKECMLCKECMNLGKVSACEEIYFFPGNSREIFEVLGSDIAEIRYDHPLTNAQEEVSLSLEKWSKSLEKEVLVWAVCGAGKTEVTFKIILQTVMNSKRVMIAVPRRDIVRELSNRLRRAFPGIPIAAFYGGSKERYDPDKRIVICTTHQALKFFKRFDLAILDEIDAYPYKGSDMLHLAVRRALKDDSRLAMMTATPNKKLRKRVQNGELNCFRIPSRHHRCPLPVPKIFLCNEKLDTEKLPPKVAELILSCTSQNYKLFVFVPRKNMVEKVKCSLINWLENRSIKQIKVEGCTSVDVRRNEKCESFARGDIDIFVVTSILERGVTIDRSNVVVINADDDRIFDDNALIQMAGRAGRTAENPRGEVIFICNRENKEIRSAINQIKEMNHYAYERGYIDHE